MKYCRATVSVISSVFLFFALVFIFSKPAHAQQAQPQFLFSWRVGNSYAPSSYKGKILPGSQSRITASFELVANGAIVSVKDQSIYWYLDDTLIGGGAGVQQITFSPFGTAPRMETLRVELPRYSGGYLIRQATIPIMNPTVVIAAPYPDSRFSGTNATATALAYFFNTPATNLTFTWSVNGQSGTSVLNPDVLQINLPAGTPSGSTLAISLQVQNPGGSQSASIAKKITYQK